MLGSQPQVCQILTPRNYLPPDVWEDPTQFGAGIQRALLLVLAGRSTLSSLPL